MFTLRQLEVFVAVARREHVTAAARDVHLSQSAVSTALAELADRLGGPLFERAGRRLALNDRGRRLLDEATDLLQRARDLEQRFRSPEAVAGRLRLGASTTIGMYLLPELLARLTTAHPAVAIDLVVDNTETIAAGVADRGLDLGFVEGPVDDERLTTLPWRKDQLRVFVAADHPLAKRRTLARRDWATHRWIVREPGSGTRAVLDRALRDRGLEIRGELTFGHSEAVKQGVRAGLGIGCLSELALRRELDAGELIALRTPGLDLTRPLHGILRRDAYPSALLTAARKSLGV
jgi:DNA-binding transcriptional LysR family regulator